MAANESVALRKRQQINKANRMMFVWVAVASALVGVSLVVSFMLFQRLTFNEKILGEKTSTVDVLKANNSAATGLKENIRLLETDEALATSKTSSDESNLQVILDALPSDGNSLAFGASLQTLISGVPSVSIESTTVDPIQGIESTDSQQQNSRDASGTTSSSSQITFRFSVVGTPDGLREVLQRLERSIRAISVTSVTTESSGGQLKLSVEGVAYYEPALTVGLKDKTVKP